MFILLTQWIPPFGILFYLLLVNLHLARLMIVDKDASIKKKWRVPERTLLLLGLIGAGPAGLMCRHFLRHKSLKRRFGLCFWGGTIVAGVLIYLAWRMGNY